MITTLSPEEPQTWAVSHPLPTWKAHHIPLVCRDRKKAQGRKLAFAECLPWDRLCSQPWGYTTEKNKSLFSGRLHLSMGVQIVNKQLNTTIKYNLSGCYVGQWGKIKHRNGDQSWHHSGERELFLHWGSEKTFLQGVIRALLMECRNFEVKYSGESMSRLVLVIYSYKTSYPKM